MLGGGGFLRQKRFPTEAAGRELLPETLCLKRNRFGIDMALSSCGSWSGRLADWHPGDRLPDRTAFGPGSGYFALEENGERPVRRQFSAGAGRYQTRRVAILAAHLENGCRRPGGRRGDLSLRRHAAAQSRPADQFAGDRIS